MQKKYEGLAERLAERTRQLRLTGGGLTLVGGRPASLPPLARRSHCRMIEAMQEIWGAPMRLLVEQACFGLPGIHALDDAELVDLHRRMELARDHLARGVGEGYSGMLRRICG